MIEYKETYKEGKLRIGVDIDGVLCDFKKGGESYFDVKPKCGAVEKLRELRKNGHYIILQTSRHMKTCNGNVSLVLKRIGKMTLDWLDKYGFEYDEIYFGIPHCDVYINDNGFRFSSWSDIRGDGSNLPISSEKMKEII